MLHEDLFQGILDKLAAYRTEELPVVVDGDEPTVMVETVEADPDTLDEEAPEESSASIVTAANLFRNAESHPIVLDLALLKKYGPEWMGWEHETLQLRIPQDFNTPTVSDLNLEKIHAAATLHLVDTFWKQWEVFVACSMAFNHEFADFQVMQAPTVPQAMVAVDIANRIRDDVPWSSEVKTYLGVMYKWGQMLCPQPPLGFVHVDTEGLPLDIQEVASMWPEARRTGKIPEGGSVEREQVRRMLAADQYLEESRRRLESQLKVISHVD